MSNKGSFRFQISGHPRANSDLELDVTDRRTGRMRTVRPYRDGSAGLKNLAAGEYELAVRHPNVVGHVIERRVLKLYPGAPTKIRIPLSPALFEVRDLADTPLANLSPVREAAQQAIEDAEAVGSKQQGDPIRSEDWNRLADGVASLASAVVQLTDLVSPDGHDHDEIKDYIDETREATQSFVESFGRRLAELQRMIQTAAVEREVTNTLGDATTATDSVRTRLEEQLGVLRTGVYQDPRSWSRTKKRAMREIERGMTALRDEQPDPDAFATGESYQVVANMAAAESESTTPTTYKGEIKNNERVEAKVGSTPYMRIFGGR